MSFPGQTHMQPDLAKNGQSDKWNANSLGMIVQEEPELVAMEHINLKASV